MDRLVVSLGVSGRIHGSLCQTTGWYVSWSHWGGVCAYHSQCDREYLFKCAMGFVSYSTREARRSRTAFGRTSSGNVRQSNLSTSVVSHQRHRLLSREYDEIPSGLPWSGSHLHHERYWTLFRGRSTRVVGPVLENFAKCLAQSEIHLEKQSLAMRTLHSSRQDLSGVCSPADGPRLVYLSLMVNVLGEPAAH